MAASFHELMAASNVFAYIIGSSSLTLWLSRQMWLDRGCRCHRCRLREGCGFQQDAPTLTGSPWPCWEAPAGSNQHPTCNVKGTSPQTVIRYMKYIYMIYIYEMYTVWILDGD